MLKQARPFETARLGGLMVLSALTEGFGLLLLVPILQALDKGSEAGAAGRLLAAAHLPASLPALLAVFVGLVALRALVNLARTLASQAFQVSIVDGLRNRVFDALLHCDWRIASAMRQSDNVSLLISNIDRIGHGVSQLLAALATGATLVAVGAAALAISPSISLAAIAGGLLVLFAYRGLSRRASRLGEELGEAYRQIHGRVSESLGALRVIKSYGREDRTQAMVADGFRALREAERAYLRDAGVAKVTLEATGALLVALLVWLAVERWGKSLGEILPLVVLFARCLPLLSVLQGTWQNWSHSSPALDEVAALIAKAEAAREPGSHDQPAPVLEQAITLEGVTVRFAGRDAPALDHVSLELPARGLTALVGPSGSGKSTLADLAGGLIAPDAGHVRIDGVSLGEILKRAWRRSVAYVQQDPVLFDGSIRDNLAWARHEATEQQLHDALARASASFVETLPAGLDTVVGEEGRQLSGGERQRIVLARALLRKPSLLILDEATSALDPENEAAIAQALAGLRKEMAILVICHRGELRNIADRIVSIDQGRIVAVEHRTKDCN